MKETEYREEDYLMLSGLQHFSFCRRQWALIHIEQQWQENVLTTQGQMLHEKAHDGYSSEKRNDVLISRGMPIQSRNLGLSGECDIVEFHKDSNGVELPDRVGNYILFPVEYKRGKSKVSDEDRMQLTAQVLCLEEMFLTDIPEAYLFYGQTRRREKVIISSELREKCSRMVQEMHQYFQRGYTPKVKTGKKCAACSLRELCIPKLNHNRTVNQYVSEYLNETDMERQE